MLSSAFAGSRPGTLLVDYNSSCTDSEKSSTDDLSSSTLAYNSDGDTLRLTAIWQDAPSRQVVIVRRERSICGTLRRIALTGMRSMDECRREGVEGQCLTSSFSVRPELHGMFVLCCQL